MQISVGIDIAKEIHWVTAIDADGVVRIDRKLLNTPSDIAALADELTALHAKVRIGLDVIGGIAGLAEAMLARAGFALVHVPGIAVNRARQGTVGGENKSDPRDARTIADQVRTRSDLRPIEPAAELDLEIRLLVSRRGDIVQAQTQRLSRMRDLLVGIFPGLEACLDLKTKGPLHLLARYVTHSELRAAGKKRLVRHLQAAGSLPNVDALADRALAAAAEQTIVAPAERITARLIRELAAEALVSRARLVELDRELEALLGRHPDAALILTLPGMGVVLTAELIAEAGNLSRFRSADALASAAGMAPVLRQSGRMRFLRRPNGGNKGLKRVFYQSAFCSLNHDDSRTFYDRKRHEGKRHHQAIIALARRRVNVLWAVIHSRTPFQSGFKTAA
jgi:transposase